MKNQHAAGPCKILVLGATGLIGNAIARELAARGHKVTATCRSQTTSANLQGLSVSVAHGDLDAPGALENSVSNQDVVIDAAAPYPLNLIHNPAGRRRPTVAFATERSRRLARALSASGGKLVLISTLLADDPETHPGLAGLQQRLMRIAHPYFAIKKTIERTLQQHAQDIAGLLIVRPPACMGPYDIKPREQSLVPKLVAGEVKVAMSQAMNLVDTRDVAAVVATAVETDQFDQTIEICGHNTSIGDLLDEIGRQTGVAPPRWRFPAPLAVLPSYWAEFAWASIGRASPLPALLPVLVSEQRWANQGARPTLGVTPRPLAQTVADTLAWYQRLGYLSARGPSVIGSGNSIS